MRRSGPTQNPHRPKSLFTSNLPQIKELRFMFMFIHQILWVSLHSRRAQEDAAAGPPRLRFRSPDQPEDVHGQCTSLTRRSVQKARGFLPQTPRFFHHRARGGRFFSRAEPPESCRSHGFGVTPPRRSGAHGGGPTARASPLASSWPDTPRSKARRGGKHGVATVGEEWMGAGNPGTWQQL